MKFLVVNFNRMICFYRFAKNVGSPRSVCLVGGRTAEGTFMETDTEEFQ
jgi:hypothetical protein